MVKPQKNRKSNTRKSRKRFTRKRNVTSFPPMIPFNKCFMDVVLRHVVEEDTPINIQRLADIKISDLLVAPWDSLKSVFSQLRIMKSVIYASAGVGFAEKGFHALNLAPKMEFEISPNTKFSTLSSLPGTKLSRIGRLVSAEWFPTSGEERKWMKVSNATVLFDYAYMSHAMDAGGKAAATYPLSLTFDYHVRLRGVNYSKLNDERTLFPQNVSNDDCGFEPLDIDN